MKKIFLFFVMFSVLSNAQYLVEDFDDNQSTTNEVTGVQIEFDMSNHLEHLRLKCSNSTYAEFPGGETAFKKVLFKNMMAYLTNDMYAVNGTFTFLFEIGKDGKVKSFSLLPKVTNGDILFEDINFAVKKINETWKPGTCDGIPVESKVRLKVNFKTENYDR